LANIPVIVASTSVPDLKDWVTDLHRQGAELLPKPFPLSELLELVRRLLAPAA
jgi:hypothetical protein